jgi:hypothetical protein
VVPWSVIVYMFVFDIAAVIVAVYCGIKSTVDFRSRHLWLGLWGAVCAVACFVFAASLWLVPYVP